MSSRREGRKRRARKLTESSNPTVDQDNKRAKTIIPAKDSIQMGKPESGLLQETRRTMYGLPVELLQRLMKYLDVSSLHHLSATNTFFHQLITGSFILHLGFPFDQSFISEVLSASVIQKKPLLLLHCTNFRTISPLLLSKQDTWPTLCYLLAYQLSLLDLSLLRQVTFAAASILLGSPTPCSCSRCRTELAAAGLFDLALLNKIEQGGLGDRISRIELLVDDISADFLDSFPNLLQLVLLASTSKSLDKLVSLVRRVRAAFLEVRVVSRVGRRPRPRLLINNCIKKLRLLAPCSLQFYLSMARLQELEVQCQDR